MQDRISIKDIHTKLGLKTHHALWFRKRAKDLSLVKKEDYVEISTVIKNGWGATKTLDYYVTFDVAILLLAKERTKASTQFMRTLIQHTHLDPDSLLSLLEDVDIPEISEVPLYVYVIQDVETHRLKIGISSDPVRRLKQLQTGSSGLLRIVAAKEAPNRFKDESIVHNACSQHRLHGEWFEPDALGTCLPLLSKLRA